MRVISGKYKSRRLKTVPSQKTRPTTDKNKENLFNIIQRYLNGGTVLDLFGGSGGLGIEAISRGMDTLYVCDKSYQAYKVIKENIEALHILNAYPLKMDYRKALSYLKEQEIKFDLILLDPPYSMKINKDIILFMQEAGMLNDKCIIVTEDLYEEKMILDKHFHTIKEMVYGITVLQIFEYREEL